MGFRKSDGSNFLQATSVSTTDRILIGQGSATREVTLGVLGAGLGYVTSASVAEFLTSASADAKYLTQSSATDFLTSASADTRYITSANAASVFQTKASSSDFITSASLNAIFITSASAELRFQTKASSVDFITSASVSVMIASKDYLTSASAHTAFLTTGDANDLYLTTTRADELYLTTIEADQLYLTSAEVENYGFLTQSSADLIYLTTGEADARYITQASVSATIEQIASSQDYITSTEASALISSQVAIQLSANGAMSQTSVCTLVCGMLGEYITSALLSTRGFISAGATTNFGFANISASTAGVSASSNTQLLRLLGDTTGNITTSASGNLIRIKLIPDFVTSASASAIADAIIVARGFISAGATTNFGFANISASTAGVSASSNTQLLRLLGDAAGNIVTSASGNLIRIKTGQDFITSNTASALASVVANALIAARGFISAGATTNFGITNISASTAGVSASSNTQLLILLGDTAGNITTSASGNLIRIKLIPDFVTSASASAIASTVASALVAARGFISAGATTNFGFANVSASTGGVSASSNTQLLRLLGDTAGNITTSASGNLIRIKTVPDFITSNNASALASVVGRAAAIANTWVVVSTQLGTGLSASAANNKITMRGDGGNITVSASAATGLIKIKFTNPGYISAGTADYITSATASALISSLGNTLFGTKESFQSGFIELPVVKSYPIISRSPRNYLLTSCAARTDSGILYFNILVSGVTVTPVSNSVGSASPSFNVCATISAGTRVLIQITSVSASAFEWTMVYREI